MTDPKQTKSKPEEKSKSNGFNCCDGNIEEMFNKMQEFCGGNEKSFNCCEMMQQMCANTSEKQKT